MRSRVDRWVNKTVKKEGCILVHRMKRRKSENWRRLKSRVSSHGSADEDNGLLLPRPVFKFEKIPWTGTIMASCTTSSLSLSLSLSRNQRGYTSYPPFVITWSLANPTWLGGYFANYPLFFPIFYVGFLFFSFLFPLVTPTPPHAMITAFFFSKVFKKKINFFIFLF
jgi:hypothetical protein